MIFMGNFAHVFMLVGGMIFAIGLLYFVAQQFGMSKLPGDIVWKKGNFTFAFPIVTSIILSVIVTIVLNVFLRK